MGTFQVSTRPLAIGAVLMAAGAVVGLAGVAISATAVTMATRRWVNEMETPPSELARQKWAQARAATQAGASAWQDGLATSSRGS
jgi:membrane protein implicated in regulation of membrane protease activity